jgi:hypothetical protein
MHIRVHYDALTESAGQLRTTAARNRDTTDIQHQEVMGSCDYWSDDNGAEGAFGARHSFWRVQSDHSIEQAEANGKAHDACNMRYQETGQQVATLMAL